MHEGRCEWKNELSLDRIVAHKNDILQRKYLVKWKGYGDDENTWEPHDHLHHEVIKEYEL